MIATSQSIKYTINDNKNCIGKIFVSKFIKNLDSYKIPFIRTEKKDLIKIGIGDYEDFDSFIISSLNDYFNKINDDVLNKDEMLDNYTKLYSLWSNICECKENNNLVKLNEFYNKISYGLCLLGYEDKQL